MWGHQENCLNRDKSQETMEVNSKHLMGVIEITSSSAQVTQQIHKREERFLQSV